MISEWSRNQDLDLVWPKCINYLCFNHTVHVSGRWCATCRWMFTSIIIMLLCQAASAVCVTQPISFCPRSLVLHQVHKERFPFSLIPHLSCSAFEFNIFFYSCLTLQQFSINEATLGATSRKDWSWVGIWLPHTTPQSNKYTGGWLCVFSLHSPWCQCQPAVVSNDIGAWMLIM